MIIPIFIPIHSSTAPYRPDNKCPKCGHEWNDEKTSLGFKIFIVALLIFVASFIVFFIDAMALDQRYYLYLTTNGDCEFNHPNFEIVSNGNGLYAVKYKPTGEYFCYGKDYMLFSSSIHTPPTLFISECSARGYLKEYCNRPFK